MPARPLWALTPLALLLVLCLVHRPAWPGRLADWSLTLGACADVRPAGAPCRPGAPPEAPWSGAAGPPAAPSAAPARARGASPPAPGQRADPACRRVLSGEAFSFGPGFQDWYIYNSFFGGRGRGAGSVLALGPAGPSTLFFTRCLGWELVAVPRPSEDGSVSEAILGAARRAGVARFELAVLNFSEAGSERLLSGCLNLSGLGADLWLVEGNQHGQRPMDLLFHTSGYGGVMTFLAPAPDGAGPGSGEEGGYVASLYRRESASLPRLPPPEAGPCSAAARYYRKQWCQTYQTVWRAYRTPWACPADAASWGPAPSPEAGAHAARVGRLLRRVEPAYAALCEAMLSGRAATFSQGWQDWFVYHNFFRDREWGDGVYVDIGTNDPEAISNTLFFDKCLGWRGACAEMNPRYHKGIRERRSCSLVPTCILGSAGMVKVANGLGETSRIVGGRGRKLVPTLNCTTFSDIILSNGFDHVDFVSIDVEGAEPNILRCLNFSAVNVSMWLVEGDKQDAHAMDRFFQRRGYSTVMTFLNAVDHRSNFYIDTLYSRLRAAPGPPLPGRPAERGPWGCPGAGAR